MDFWEKKVIGHFLKGGQCKNVGKTSVLFDGTATNLIKTADVNLKSITIGIWEEYLNLVASEAGFSVVSGAKVSVLMLLVSFVHQCLNAKVRAVNYWFCGKIRCF